MKIILASKSGVRKQILDKHNIDSEVIVSNVDEDEIKQSLLAEGANPLSISKNLAEIKSIKVSNKEPDRLVLGADSVISLNEELINKPNSREEAFKILKSKRIYLESNSLVTLCLLDMTNSTFVPQRYPVAILDKDFKTAYSSRTNKLFRVPIYLVGIDNLFSENFTMNVNMAEVRGITKHGRDLESYRIFYMHSPWPSLKSRRSGWSAGINEFHGMNTFLSKKFSSGESTNNGVWDFVSDLNDLAFCSFRDSDNMGRLALLGGSTCESYSSSVGGPIRTRTLHSNALHTRDFLRRYRVSSYNIFKNENEEAFYERWKIYSGDLDPYSYKKHKNLEDTDSFPSSSDYSTTVNWGEGSIDFSAGRFNAFTQEDSSKIIEAYNSLDLSPEKPQFVKISPSG